jgi:hypothetical protein
MARIKLHACDRNKTITNANLKPSENVRIKFEWIWREEDDDDRSGRCERLGEDDGTCAKVQ